MPHAKHCGNIRCQFLLRCCGNKCRRFSCCDFISKTRAGKHHRRIWPMCCSNLRDQRISPGNKPLGSPDHRRIGSKTWLQHGNTFFCRAHGQDMQNNVSTINHCIEIGTGQRRGRDRQIKCRRVTRSKCPGQIFTPDPDTHITPGSDKCRCKCRPPCTACRTLY